jgi:hypothetical protein
MDEEAGKRRFHVAECIKAVSKVTIDILEVATSF